MQTSVPPCAPSSTADAQERQALAAAHVTRRQAAGEMADVDPTVWEQLVVEHLVPLPADRPWRLRARRRAVMPVSVLAPAVAARLAPPAGTRPQPNCPTACFVTHAFEPADEVA